MLILPKKIGLETLDGLDSTQPGLYDVVEISNLSGTIIPVGEVSKFGRDFLGVMSAALQEGGIDFSEHTQGGMYYRVIDRSQADPLTDKGGEFHYDTRRSVLRTDEGPIRVVAAITSDGSDISNVFSSNPNHRGRFALDVMREGGDDLVFSGNGSIVLFDEELDLHARPPAIEHIPETSAVFISAILRKPIHEIIDCVAFSSDAAETQMNTLVRR